MVSSGMGRFCFGTAAIFHENVENPSVSVDVSVVLSHNVP